MIDSYCVDYVRSHIKYIIWASTPENLSSGFANNTGADQPAHPRYLISAFAFCKLPTDEISIFKLVSVAEDTGLKLVCKKPRRQVFSRRGPYLCNNSQPELFKREKPSSFFLQKYI